jgi:hypothetical protein
MNREVSPNHKESHEESPSLFLTNILKGLERISPIAGMGGQKEEDPVAQEILNVGSENLREVEMFLKDQGITTLAPLKSGYGFSAVVLDAQDKVVRLSRMKPTLKPSVPHVLQPLVSTIVGRLSVQISEKLETDNITEADVERLQNDLKAIGYQWNDAGTDNVGRDHNGNLLVIDGSVTLSDLHSSI